MGSGKDQMEYPKNMKDRIFLIGFMGTGKSAIASYLSSQLGWDSVDTDELIIRAAEGMAIKDIFSCYGEAYFRNLESKVLSDIKKRLERNSQAGIRNRIAFGNQGHLIVSCGGGIVLRDENIEMMKALGVIVLLTASPETIYERVNASAERPLLNKNMNVEAIAALMSDREERYRKAADLIVSTDGKTVEGIAEEIIGMLN